METHPTVIYFSIGDVVAALAIILAFRQFAGQPTLFRLNIARKRKKTAYALFGFSILSVFSAALLPYIPGRPLPLVGYPFFWEFIAGISFVVAAIVLLFIIEKPGKFNKQNYKIFFSNCMSIISKGDDKEIRSLAVELRYSAKEIIQTCALYNKTDAADSKKLGKDYIVTEYTEHAIELLNILSDEQFCTILVCSAPGTALSFINEIKKNKLYDSGGYTFVRQLINQSYLNRASILYREEEEFYGLGRFSTFTKSIFGDYEFIKSHFRPLSAWRPFDDKYLDIRTLKIYTKTLLTAFDAYITSKEYSTFSFSIYDGVKNLTNCYRNYIETFRKNPEETIYSSDSYYALDEILKTFKEIVGKVTEAKQNFPDYAFNEQIHMAEYTDPSIYRIVANGIFDFFQIISSDREHDEVIRFFLIRLWHDIFPVSLSLETKSIKEIQQRFLFLLKDETADNDYYNPLIIRLLININGLREWNEPMLGINIVNNYIMEFLKKHINLLESKGVVQNILPLNFKYEKDINEIIHKDRWSGRIINRIKIK